MNSLVQDAAAAGARVGLRSDEIVIRGGKPLVGRIEVRGAKNLATKAMVAALLGDTPSILRDVPDISDVQVVRGLLEVHGVRITDPARGELILDPSNVESAHFAEIDAHAGSSRIPILFCGPLLHKLGEAFIPRPRRLPHRRPPIDSTSTPSARWARSWTSRSAASTSRRRTA